MDPFWTWAVEYWWLAPAALGAGALGVVSVRLARRGSGRRLAVDAARNDLRHAQDQVTRSRNAVKLARAEHARLIAQRAASRAAAPDVAAARQAVRQSEHEVKAAAAEVRVRRIHLSSARAEMPSSSDQEAMPLSRLRVRHDTVTARWMDYETDPAKLISFPNMTDARQPETAAYLTAAQQAQALRRDVQDKTTPAAFAAYRDRVIRLEQTFDAAERAARADTEPVTNGWQDAAQAVVSRSAEALDRAAEAAASALAAWQSRPRAERPPEPPRPEPGSKPQPKPDAKPTWPVPRRDGT